MSDESAFEVARQVADAVLLEGYVLYPYRASAQKNQVRWQFGVLAPREAGSSEPWFAQTECLVEPQERPSLDITVRFLQVQARTGPADIPWDEGTVREVSVRAPLDRLGAAQVIPFELAGAEEAEGGTVRRRWPLTGAVVVRPERLDGPYGVLKIRVRVENHTRWSERSAPREEMLRRSLVATHTLLKVRDGTFVSLLDPPEWAGPAAASCDNQHTWPVLVGEGRRDLMLSSPIILYDYPEIAPESPADLYDATEIDEILTLRTMALTDEEKAEARATDERAAALIDRVDDMPPELMERLHGAVRYLRAATGEARNAPTSEPDEPACGPAPGPRPRDAGSRPLSPDPRAQSPNPRAQSPNPRTHSPNPPWWDPGQDSSVAPETDTVPIPGGRAAKGTRVRLWPGRYTTAGPQRRRTDAQDMFWQGHTATVAAVFFDVDGGSYLAVTLDDDPAAELHDWVGRYHYFSPDEVELVPERDEQAPEEGGP